MTTNLVRKTQVKQLQGHARVNKRSDCIFQIFHVSEVKFWTNFFLRLKFPDKAKRVLLPSLFGQPKGGPSHYCFSVGAVHGQPTCYIKLDLFTNYNFTYVLRSLNVSNWSVLPCLVQLLTWLHVSDYHNVLNTKRQ